MKKQLVIFRVTLFFICWSFIFGFNINPYSLNIEPEKRSDINIINPRAIDTVNVIPNTFSQVIEYDLLTDTERIKRNPVEQINQIDMLSSIDTLENEYLPHPKETYSSLKSSFPFPPDDRERITTTSSYPWSTICKLFITAEDGTEFIGSGFIVDEFHILTCGHCIYIHEHGGWVDEVEVVPGMDGNYEPFGSAYATYLRTYTGWIDSEMPEHDWAMVTLDRNIGDLTGWMGIMTDIATSSIYTGTLYTAGYPYDLGDGYYMYYDSDTGYDADEYNHWYWMDTAAGQSGSPVWLEDQGEPYVVSIHAYEYEDGKYPNMGTRINFDKFDQISEWLEEDSPSAPIDHAELLDRGYYSNISTTSIISGVTNFGIICDVLNEGTTTASSFKVKYYASINSSITPTDYLLGTTILHDLGPFEYMSADWSGIFPSTIPDGNYYIGWIIDADNEIDEQNEDNNVVFSYAFYVQVETRDVFDSMNYVYISIILVIAVIVVVAVVSFILARRRYPDFEMFFPTAEAIPTYKAGSEVKPQQKYPTPQQEIIKFCPNCGQGITRQTQRFCISCGFELSNISDL